MPWRASARMAAIWVSSTPGTETAADVRCLADGHRLLGGQRTHPLHRLEADRTHHDQLAGDRLEQQLGLADQRRELGFDPGRGDQFFEGLQPGAALTAERDGVGLAGSQTVDEGVRTDQSFVILTGSVALSRSPHGAAR